jgi:aminocarboxymuconate-semialdehyde decarboxylase
MIVDIHCHYVPEEYFAFVEQGNGYRISRAPGAGESVTVTVGDLPFGMNKTFFDSERQIARMDSLGIDLTVVSLATPLIDYSVSAELAIAAARIFNDQVARLRDRRPDRFDGWAFLPMQNPDAAAAELRRAVTDLGLRGGHIASNVNGRYLDSAEYAPVFAAAVDLDVPLFVHPANPPGRERMATYELAVVSGYLFDTTLNVFYMIFGGLLDRYPTLRLCCAHAGGYVLLLRARMQREVDTNPDLAKSITRPVGDYLKQLYYDTVCFEDAYIRYAADVVGADKLVLGSDGPFPLGEPDPVRFIERSFGNDRAVLGIFHDNAARMFNASGGKGNQRTLGSPS